MFVRVFFTKSWLVVNKVFGLRFGEQSNGYSRGKNKAGLIAHTYTQRQTQMQTHSQGTITDQKHQSSNHTHYIHVLAIPSSLLTSPCVWLKLVCVCKHTQCICECVCVPGHIWAYKLCVGVIPCVSVWKYLWGDYECMTQILCTISVFPGRRVKYFHTECVLVLQKQSKSKREKEIPGLTHNDSWKNMFTVVYFHKAENKCSVY